MEPQRPIHTLGGERQKRRKNILQERRPRDRTRSVLCTRVENVRSHCCNGNEHAEADEGQGDRGNDPRELSVRSPGEVEQAAREAEEGRWDAEVEPRFGDRCTRILLVRARRAEVQLILSELRHQAYNLSNHERALHEAGGIIIPGEELRVDLHDGLREHVSRADAEGGPHAEGEDDGFGAEHACGTDDGLAEQGGKAKVMLFGGGVDGEVFGGAEVACAAGEDDIGPDFWEAEEEEGEEGAVEGDLGVEDPGVG